MATEFMKQKLLDNIMKIIAKRGIKVGELETAVGLYPGYLSRMKNEEGKIPGIDVIWRMAKYLGLTIDQLTDGDFDHSTENLEYLDHFVQSMYERTLSGELEWKSVKTVEINNALLDQYTGSVSLPFIAEKKDVSAKKLTYINPVDDEDPDVCGLSATEGGNKRVRSFVNSYWKVAIEDSAFYVDLGSRIFFFIEYFTVDWDQFNECPVEEYWYEIVSAEQQNAFEDILICSSYGEYSPLHISMKKLCDHLREHENDIKISGEVRSIVDDFLLSDPDQLPF